MWIPLHCFNAEFMHMPTGPSQKNRDVKTTHYMQTHIKIWKYHIAIWWSLDHCEREWNGVTLTCPLCRLLCKCIEASCCCFPSHRSQLRHQTHLTAYWNANQAKNLLYVFIVLLYGGHHKKIIVYCMQIYVYVNSMVIVHLLSSINNLNVQGVNSIAMNTINISVVVQLQTQHPKDTDGRLSYARRCIHTCINSYIHTYIHAYIKLFTNPTFSYMH